MSPCSAQAVSQVGCRLMVASSAKINRPRLPAVAAGPSARTLSRKASISGLDEAGAGVRSLLMEGVYINSGISACPRLARSGANAATLLAPLTLPGVAEEIQFC